MRALGAGRLGIGRRTGSGSRGGPSGDGQRAAITPLLLELERSGPAPLRASGATGGPPSVAAIVPSFRRGSGGHTTIVHLLQALAEQGHAVSVWLEDYEGRHVSESPARTSASFRDFFGGSDLVLQTDFSRWEGADVILATGWQTVPRSLVLPDARARAYLVQDHEPDFYPASAESVWAEWTYRQGLHCIAASRWLAELLRLRYGARATHFDLAVDHAIYAPQADLPGREDLVVFYARTATPRRAVPLGLAALKELAARHPELEIVLFGETPGRTPGPHREAGVLDPQRLAELYRSATVGLVLSLTNPSLIGLEMSACGLPCVELASESMLASFGREGPLLLAEPGPVAICAALEQLLGDRSLRARRSQDAIASMADRTWTHAGRQVSLALSEAPAGAGP